MSDPRIFFLCAFLSLLSLYPVIVHSAAVVVVAPGSTKEGPAVNVTLPETANGESLRVNITVNPDSSFNLTTNVGNSTSSPTGNETSTVTAIVARPIKVKRESVPVRVTMKPRRTSARTSTITTTTTTDLPVSSSSTILNDENDEPLSTPGASDNESSTSSSTSVTPDLSSTTTPSDENVDSSTLTSASTSKRPTTSSKRRRTTLTSTSKPEKVDLDKFLETPGNTVVVMSKRPNFPEFFGEDGSSRGRFNRLPSGVRVISSSPFDTDSELVASRPFMIQGVDLGGPEDVVIMDDQDLK